MEIKNIYKQYKSKEVLKGVSFDVNAGEIIGILGPNGVGKTTLIKLLCGINCVTSGEIKLNNNQNVSVVFDYNGLYSNFNALENLKVFGDDYACDSIETILKLVGLWEYKDKKVQTYSKGMLRRLTIARALLKKPDVLILDEPFDGLDIESRNYWIDFLTNWVNEGKRSIIISSHIMSDIESLCNRLIVLYDGHILCDNKIQELKSGLTNFVKIVLAKEYDNGVLQEFLSEYHVIYETPQSSKEINIYNIDKSAQQKIIKNFVQSGMEVEEFFVNKMSLTDIYLDLLKKGDEML